MNARTVLSRGPGLTLSAACAAIVCLFASTGCNKLLSDTSGGGTPAVSGPRRVYALGRLEPRGGVISISAIPGERVAELDPDVAENAKAPANGVLGKLASYDLRAAQLAALKARFPLVRDKQHLERDLAEAQLMQAEAALAQAQAKEAELLAQQPKLAVLKRASELAHEEYDHLAGLQENDPDLVTPLQLAKQKNKMDLAEQEYLIASKSFASAKTAARKTVEAAEKNCSVAKNNIERLGPDEVTAFQREIQVAENTLTQSVLWTPDAEVDRSKVSDVECRKGDPPGRYTVLKIYTHAGEFATQMPILQLADLSQMDCIAEVYEADVKAVRKGQGVTIRSSAFSGPFADGKPDASGKRSGGIRGEVESIGGLISAAGLSNRNPLAPADRSVVEVRIAITDEAAIAHARSRVGLQVTVEFDPIDGEE